MQSEQSIQNQSIITEISSVQNKKEYLTCFDECKRINRRDKGDLNKRDDYDCPKCNNRGYVLVPQAYGNKYQIVVRTCECIKTRAIIKKLEKSGLKNVIKKYTFDNYITEENWQKYLKEKALKFIDENDKWFFIGGQSGSGKTHLCTAVCGEFLKMNKSVFYMLWISDCKDLKNTINDYEKHNELLRNYRESEVLYIDDFLKNGKEKDGNIQPPTLADIQLAYDILNFRYNNPNLITIISSERMLSDIMDIDEAAAGRIYERADSGKYIFNIKKDRSRNFRTKNYIEI